MARASWKYHFFNKSDVEHYTNYLIDEIKPTDINLKRHTTLTKLNYFIPTEIYFGKSTIIKNFSRYHISFKVGQFTKNRKPFFFRSKKKKNVTKKYNL